MIHLLVVSFVWAFSFGLIKTRLSGIDPDFVAFCRMVLSLAVFLPFFRPRGIRSVLALKLVLVGALQFGVMYIAYIASYRFLLAHQVAVCTIFTPLYVALVDDALGKRFRPLLALAALLAVAGTWIVLSGDAAGVGLLSGFLLMQVSNLCFAAGQVFYRRIMRAGPDLKDREIFAFLYIGAVLVTAPAAVLTAGPADLRLEPGQVLALLYLGLLASGLCFFLWNYGAKRTSAGLLSVMNNVKIPLAVACSLLFFGEKGNVSALLWGGAVILAALVLGGAAGRGKNRA